MAINFDKALGVHPQALTLRERRGEVLASNLANADTPGFKARDLNFQSVLQGAMPDELPIERTRSGHAAPSDLLLGANLMFRNPHQASLDGNTVESHIEQAKFSENAVQYQASLRFINGKFSGLMTAIKGESA
ncbi:MAG: flagellar basal body rod protein FlgB [Methylicorpusculum sp.]|uniref:flagellar basal body rod protein FlgB n=1 Tax=Methylicorpusculum sp. TaxID=2713644 RepID=UPI00271AEB38|nr:flagellar basal body rod protein FlgB [Methylicorpusculum sp.]MDO8843824.1 flagellar basal body rod protein FlgB [Methylicorpusculum sp.]MDO8940225.1 flagellar basal body rod protein FlgB [Methylicorpusculum sp.]MDO9239389.1 flagellar basal body rod protein FlgB [Methylicorpusculum sp.]MDP2201094.1 flagellar basal body rod protein FlgB [Methylicorpusculum sp.]